MTMGTINEYILEKAKAAGICEPGALEIAKAGTVDELLAFYRRGIDFCLEKNFPSTGDLVKLGGDKLKEHGIWVDQPVAVRDAEFTVLLGASNGKVSVSRFTVSQMFVKHQSAVAVDAAENAFVVIDCFDDSVISVTASGNSKVLINVYGQAKVTHVTADSATIKIVHKNKVAY
jgi:hypothetical protein